MPAVIQIAVAGVLLLAWIWVLGRPLMASRRRTPYEEFLAAHPDRVPTTLPADAPEVAETVEADHDLFDAHSPLERLQGWWQRPAHVWRRQLLLATMIATFVSFFLAVALRSSLGNTFLYLFAMMVFGLLIHLGIAAYVGSQMMAAGRAVRVRHAQSRVQPGGMSINADQVGGETTGVRRPILEDDRDVALFEFDEQDHGDEGDSAFNLAADIASALDADEDAGIIDEVAEVNEMIESAWADDEPEPEAVFEVDDVDEADPAADHAFDEGDVAPTADGGDGDGDGEAIFRRAAKDEPPRPRRKPQPIYIESQLDDDDGDGPRAVNFP